MKTYIKNKPMNSSNHRKLIKKRKFHVSRELLRDVLEILEDDDLIHEIEGVTPDKKIIVAVTYANYQRSSVYKLMDLVDDYE
jgi:hypothetical protein